MVPDNRTPEELKLSEMRKELCEMLHVFDKDEVVVERLGKEVQAVEDEANQFTSQEVEDLRERFVLNVSSHYEGKLRKANKKGAATWKTESKRVTVAQLREGILTWIQSELKRRFFVKVSNQHYATFGQAILHRVVEQLLTPKLPSNPSEKDLVVREIRERIDEIKDLGVKETQLRELDRRTNELDRKTNGQSKQIIQNVESALKRHTCSAMCATQPLTCTKNCVDQAVKSITQDKSQIWNGTLGSLDFAKLEGIKAASQLPEIWALVREERFDEAAKRIEETFRSKATAADRVAGTVDHLTRNHKTALEFLA